MSAAETFGVPRRGGSVGERLGGLFRRNAIYGTKTKTPVSRLEFQTVDKTPACFPRWDFVLRIKNNKKRLIYAVFWRFCGIMIVTNLK